MRISDWSSDVCSSDLSVVGLDLHPVGVREPVHVAVVVLRDELVIACQRLVPAHRLLVRLQHTQWLYLEGDVGDHTQGTEPDPCRDRKSTSLNSSHSCASRMPSSA